MWSTGCLTAWLFGAVALGFNLDEQFATVLRGDPGSYFGFSVAFHQNSQGNQALVAAIRANSSLPEWSDIHEPGVLYRCPLLQEGRPCKQVVVEASGNEDHPNNVEYLRYYDLKDNMTLGMSMDVSSKGDILVCAPLWKNQKWPGVYLPNGACYVLDKNFRRLRKLVPLIKRLQQAVNMDYYYYAAEMGFSAAFTKKDQVVLGTPGFSNWEGSVVRYGADISDESLRPPVPLARKAKDTYKGYSVATGKMFRDTDVTLAMGAPRSNDYKGEVFLFDFDAPWGGRATPIKARLYGGQMCEYFGASLLAVDLDKDGDGGMDDLLVGAPMYTHPDGMDEGRVYVYRSSGSGLYARGALEGSRAKGARFGTSIAGVGDLNLDGYQDVAVGAPYENDVGAVYIYHGNVILDGKSEYAQRIAASSVSSRIGVPLKGFGISISKGFDVDSNRYQDVLVGAYASDSAVLFRSRPIAELRGSIKADVSMITADIGSCEVSGGDTFSCFKLISCVRYYGKFVSPTVEVETELSIDVKRVADNRPVRGFMYNNVTQVNKYSSLLTARVNHSTCETRMVYLQAVFADPVTPFVTRLEYRLREPSEQRWCPTCPVLDKDLPQAVTQTIPYQHGCRSDDVCRSDLKLNVELTNYDSSSPLVVGERRDLSVSVVVENKQSLDPAYLARVVITLPATVGVVNKDRCSVQRDRDAILEKILIVCDAGNPMRPGRRENFMLKLDMSHVQETFSLSAEATTTSEESTPKDNKVLVTLPFVYQADIAMLGKAKPEVVTFNPETKSILMEHGFVLVKQYASPIQQVELSLHVPYVFSESQPPISYVKMIKVLQGDLFVPGTCRSVEGYFSHNDSRGVPESAIPTEAVSGASKNGTVGVSGRVQRAAPETDFRPEGLSKLLYRNIPPLNCKTSLCHEIRCNLGPFLNRHRIAQIMLYIVFNMTEFTRQAGIWHAFSVGSEGSLKILDNTTFISGATFQKEIRVATVLQKEGPPPAKKVAAWIVAVSAFCGLILFSLIIAGLVHLGFFRRQQREALERLLKEEQDQNEWNEFMVTEAEVEAEKEYFRKSMMAGVEDFNLEDFKGEPGAAFEPELDSATTDEKAVAFANYSYSSPPPPQM
ncbi:integrin alpha-5 [Ixodes scapularis]|uniref:integrin alpha-5 n=1 Tax=Ixodes scapularis TaxID=6945 RepID=UPI001A9E31C0|nr:integrin alpha-5 [Ixodes scapularis]